MKLVETTKAKNLAAFQHCTTGCQSADVGAQNLEVNLPPWSLQATNRANLQREKKDLAVI